MYGAETGGADVFSDRRGSLRLRLLRQDQSIPSSSFGPLLGEVLCSFAARRCRWRDRLGVISLHFFLSCLTMPILPLVASSSPLRRKKNTPLYAYGTSEACVSASAFIGVCIFD